MASKSKNKNFFVNKLLQLQNFIKRDSASYKDEFLQVFHNYESNLKVYLMKPSKPNKQVADLALFLAHVSHCYPDELKEFPQQMVDLLKKYSTVLNSEMRLAFCKSLMLIRSKGLIEPIPLFQAFFGLIKCPDKSLRKTLYTHLLNDAKKIKTKQKNFKLCSQLQQYVYTLTTKENHPMIAKYAINLLMDLYKKQIWNDAKTVNVIANACFCKITKVVTLALQFFAGKDTEANSDDESDSDNDDKQSAQQILMSLRVGKKTKSRQKRTQRALRTIKKDKKSKKSNGIPIFSALNLIYDPHDFAEKLFKLVETTNESFEIKLAIIDLISRLIGIHSLFLTNFHSFLIRFLNPHQREVPKMLWFASISSHDLTPPDTVEPLLMTIANNFVTDRNNSEVIAVGLNAIREICSRCPLAMNEDLLGDLIQYKNYKDKAVSYAAKSLIQLFREKNPQLLQKKLRGKPTEMMEIEGSRIRQYGEIDAKSFIPGAEVIAVEEMRKARQISENDNEDEKEWEEIDDEDDDEDENSENRIEAGNKAKKRKHSDDSEDDDDGDEWIDVSSDEFDEVEAVENAEEDPEVSKLTLKEKEEHAMKISMEKILTQDDFKKIRMEQLKKKITDKNFVKGNKKQKTITIEDDSDDNDNEKAKRDGLVPLSNITSINKKKKQDKEARIARVMEGRKDRGKFGQRVKDSHLGKTNKEKRKTKSFMMIRHKANQKHKRSFKDKQVALRNSLLKQKRMK